MVCAAVQRGAATATAAQRQGGRGGAREDEGEGDSVWRGMRPGEVVAPGYLFGGTYEGLPFYVCQATGISIWELPPADHLAAVARTQVWIRRVVV